MNPDLFTIGEIVLPPYKVAILTAMIIGSILALKNANNHSLTPSMVAQGIVMAITGGLIGARVAYVLLHLDGSVATQILLEPSFMALSFHGAAIGSILFVLLWCKFKKQNFFQFSDLMAPYLFLGYAITRAGGCFVAGCCYGTSSDVPWAIVMERLSDDIARHPVQIYASLLAIGIVIVMHYIKKIQPMYGVATISGFGLYGVLRFVTDFFREANVENMFWFLTEAQVASIVLVAGSIGLVFFMYNLPHRGFLDNKQHNDSPKNEHHKTKPKKKKKRKKKKKK